MGKSSCQNRLDALERMERDVLFFLVHFHFLCFFNFYLLFVPYYDLLSSIGYTLKAEVD